MSPFALLLGGFALLLGGKRTSIAPAAAVETFERQVRAIYVNGFTHGYFFGV